MKVIALNGWKRSGKDTVGEFLIKSNSFTRVSFADPLKNMVSAEFNIPRSDIDNPETKEAPIMLLPVLPRDNFTLGLCKMLYKEFRTASGQTPLDFYVDESGAFLGVMGRNVEQLYWTPRALCIFKGSGNRAVRSDYWVQKAIEYVNTADLIAKEVGEEGKVVITDMRYRSEMEQLYTAFGKDLTTVRINRFDSVDTQDPSERDLDNAKFDVIIENKGTIEELKTKVKELIKGA